MFAGIRIKKVHAENVAVRRRSGRTIYTNHMVTSWRRAEEKEREVLVLLMDRLLGLDEMREQAEDLLE